MNTNIWWWQYRNSIEIEIVWKTGQCNRSDLLNKQCHILWDYALEIIKTEKRGQKFIIKQMWQPVTSVLNLMQF